MGKGAVDTMNETVIDVVILLGVFYLTFSSLGKAIKYLSLVKTGFSSNARTGILLLEAGCCFLVLSMFCASFFPMRQHMSNSVATSTAKDKAIEEGRTAAVENMWVEADPKLLDTIATLVIMSVLAFGIRIGDLFLKSNGCPVYYAIIIFPMTPFFLYHFFSWGLG